MRAVTEKKEVRCLGDLGVISPVPQTLLGDPSGQLQLLLCLGRHGDVLGYRQVAPVDLLDISD